MARLENHHEYSTTDCANQRFTFTSTRCDEDDEQSPVYLAQRGRPIGVLVSVEQWNALQEQLDDLQCGVWGLKAEIDIAAGREQVIKMTPEQLESWAYGDEKNTSLIFVAVFCAKLTACPVTSTNASSTSFSGWQTIHDPILHRNCMMICEATTRSSWAIGELFTGLAMRFWLSP